MVAGTDAVVEQVVGEPVGPLVELPVRHSGVAGDERGAVRAGVGHDLEQVGQVEDPVAHGESDAIVSANASIDCRRASARESILSAWAFSPIIHGAHIVLVMPAAAARS